MPSKIVKITGDLAEGEDTELVKEPQNTQILQKIESNMTKLGYEKTTDPANADLVLFPAVWTNTTVCLITITGAGITRTIAVGVILLFHLIQPAHC